MYIVSWPFKKVKILFLGVHLLEKSFQMVNSNLGLIFRWTLPLRVLLQSISIHYKNRHCSDWFVLNTRISSAINFDAALTMHPGYQVSIVFPRLCRQLLLKTNCLLLLRKLTWQTVVYVHIYYMSYPLYHKVINCI